MAYQTLECDRRGGLAARERREELSDPVPVLCDPIEVTRNLLAYKFARVGYPFDSGSHKMLWSRESIYQEANPAVTALARRGAA